MSDRIAILDFETEAIQNRPHYPPRPVGIAVSLPDGTNEYWAWGHPVGNNIDEDTAAKRVSAILHSHITVWHNAKFDLEVAQKWLGCEFMPWDMWEDTMLLAFLDNPHSPTLALKELAHELLDLPPTERDEVRDWIKTNLKINGKQWGAHIAEAPGDLVGRYAKGDVLRTRQLYDLLHPRIVERKMAGAYIREKKLIPIMVANEQQGICVDVATLAAHEQECSEDFERVDHWIRQHLNAPTLNLDEETPLADALESAGKVTKWVLTETGQRSTAKPALAKMLTDRMLYAALLYRGSMATCLRTFMRPWLELANSNGGRVYTSWSTTKQEEGGGTRTGRLSSSKPLNLQNIPSDFEEKLGPLFAEVGLYEELDVAELPTMRNYIIADSPDHVLLGRDFASQEPRTFAHFEYGWLCAKYNVEPDMDVYLALVEIVKERSGITITRKMAKTVFLGILYGMGVAKLAAQLGVSDAQAAQIKDALLLAVPTIRELTQEVTQILRDPEGEIRTWGGRLYKCQPPIFVEGNNGYGQKQITFEYKGVNILCQGSAADETKEAVIRYAETAKHSRLILQVHDEIVICCPKEHAAEEMEALRRAMEGLELDVPMLSTGESGYRWGMMKETQNGMD